MVTRLAPTRTISASEFKAKCLSLMDEVRESGKSILITKNGKPVAALSPPPASTKPRSMFGFYKGKITELEPIDWSKPICDPEDWSTDIGDIEQA